MDVWNSRPLDVHRWSDYSEVNDFINPLWKEFCNAYPEYVKTKRGPQPKARDKDQFKVLILDLYVCWLEDPTQCIGVHKSPTKYVGVESRYNKLHISAKIIELVEKLDAIGWLDTKPGSHNRSNPKYNRTTRLKATGKLIEKFEETAIGIEHIGHAPNKESVILTDKEVTVDEVGRVDSSNTVNVDYIDTEKTNYIRSILDAYNTLLSKTHVDIPSLSSPLIERETTDKKGRRRKHRVKILQNNKFVRRIFSNNSWEDHGRLYGGFWQQVKSEWRSQIFIDHHDTVEIDFKALHVNLIYATKIGKPLEWGDDPYALSRLVSTSPDSFTQRKRLKGLILVALNATNLKSAFRAFRNKAKPDSAEKKLKDNQLVELLDAFLAEYPEIEPYIGVGIGNELMTIDGNITFSIIRQLTQQNIPVLTVHDSYIVKRIHFEDLRVAMYRAVLECTGGGLFASSDQIPADLIDHSSLADQQLENRNDSVWITEEYEERWKRFNKLESASPA